jgi:hypothetical protein
MSSDEFKRKNNSDKVKNSTLFELSETFVKAVLFETSLYSQYFTFI